MSRKTYGSPRMTHALRACGIHCGKNRVARLMKSMGLRGVQKGRFRPRTTQSRHGDTRSPNRLKKLTVLGPNKAWAADITCVLTQQGWAYLAAVMDLGTRQIRGWALRNNLSADLVKEAFRQAVRRHRPAPGLIHHSDQGCQYTSRAFRQLLAQHGALSSMGRTGNCYDNAAMESFWATLKAELVQGQRFQSLQQTRLALFDYIDIFYNRHRLHSAIGYKPPDVYEDSWYRENFCPRVSNFLG